MSTHGFRWRSVFSLDISVGRNFDDSSSQPTRKQVNEPTLMISLNRFSVAITRRPHRWFLNRQLGGLGTPWCFVEWSMEPVDYSGYNVSGDWTEYHDSLIDSGQKRR